MTRGYTVALMLVAAFAIATPTYAQNNSTTQMQLVKSDVFTNRLQYLGVQISKEVLEETASASVNGQIPAYTVACHALRANFARQFILNAPALASLTSIGIAGANFSGAVIVGTVTGSGATADSSASDTALSQAYRILWNTFAGCAVN